MSLLGGHLGSRTSALLDGQLPADDAERAWLHVSECGECQQLVEREAWLKRRLACLSQGPMAGAPSALKGALLGAPGMPAFVDAPGAAPASGWSRRLIGLAAVGGGALSAAVMGVLTVGAAPADTPGYQPQQTVPVTAVTAPVGTTSAVMHGGRR